jgi:hypothetical protein
MMPANCIAKPVQVLPPSESLTVLEAEVDAARWPETEWCSDDGSRPDAMAELTGLRW